MKKWAFALLMIFATALVAGNECYDECYESCGCMWGVGAEALYWLPLECDRDYANSDVGTIDEPAPAPRVWSITPGYDWGFRVQGWVTNGCYYGGASYHWFKATQGHRIVGEDPFINISPIPFNTFLYAEAYATDHNRFESAEARVGKVLKCGCGSWAGAFLGVRWVDIEQEQRVKGLRPNAPFFEVIIDYEINPDFCGVGPSLGIEGRTGILECYGSWGIFGRASLAALIGSRGVKDEYAVTLPDGSTLTSKTQWNRTTSVVPEGEFGFGLDYMIQCGCFGIGAHIGYEVHYLWKVVSVLNIQVPPQVGQTLAESFQRECQDIGYAGLTFGLMASF